LLIGNARNSLRAFFFAGSTQMQPTASSLAATIRHEKYLRNIRFFKLDNTFLMIDIQAELVKK
jgi:hypothetical protein